MEEKEVGYTFLEHPHHDIIADYGKVMEVENKFNVDLNLNFITPNNAIDKMIAGVKEQDSDYSFLHLITEFSFESMINKEALHPLNKYIEEDYFKNLPECECQINRGKKRWQLLKSCLLLLLIG